MTLDGFTPQPLDRRGPSQWYYHSEPFPNGERSKRNHAGRFRPARLHGWGCLLTLKQLVPEHLRVAYRNRRVSMRQRMLLLDRVSDWSILRRLRPHRQELGKQRGKYIDRFYVEAFLARHKEAIYGHVAEVQSAEYTRLFGGERIARSDVIDINIHNPHRTITLDLTDIAAAPENRFDCIICTQTLFLIRDYTIALRSLRKMLRPGGALLATVPGICPVIHGHLIAGNGEDWWRFTSRSAKHAFAEVFGETSVEVQSYGNILTTTAFLHGLVQEELTRQELEYNDPAYELLIGISAVKTTVQ